MTRAELAEELTVVTRQLAILTAVVESLAMSLRSPQDGLDSKDDQTPRPMPGMPACTCPPCRAERAEGRRL